jgi:hypothetical protein
MGVVYEAFDRQLNVGVALKTMRNFSGDAILRFKNEFRALQDIRHPNLVSLGELIREAGQWFFTMELVDGLSFLDYVRHSEGAATLADTDPQVASERDTLPAALASPRASVQFDEARLRAAFVQLMRGLAALHAVKKVHRDVKPSNVLVAPDGRVVLLDFGLITDLRADQSTGVNAVGTPAYMAPEQAAAKPCGPEADCYSAGVVLYEALTGELPFSGTALEMMLKKQTDHRLDPRTRVNGLPEDLAEVCCSLLAVEPAARPNAAEILKRLGTRKSALALQTVTVDSSFVGRAEELGVLRAAFARVTAGEAVTLFVEGESGVGKSALVRHFVEQLGSEATVLQGRCYERESVPYKALDGVVDSLSRHLTRLPEAQSAALLPRHVGVLTQVFPVLLRVDAMGRAPRSGAAALDPQELRTRLFAAIRELVARLADRRPVVLVIDDFQWADADSCAMLVEIARGPDAPRLLVLGTCRHAPEGLAALQPQHVLLSGLPPDDACTLASRLLSEDHDAASSAATIAKEAAGHPLFIDELVRHARGRHETSTPLQLDDALWARVSRLHSSARALLDILAVAGAPLPQAVVARAAGLEQAAFEQDVATLQAENLARPTGRRARDAADCYHDRVRATVLGRMSAAQKRACHEALARSLAASKVADAETLTLHWREAGHIEQAALHAVQAAEQASKALAFDRAARLFRTAIELAPNRRQPKLLERLGDAYANDGRGKDAADAYLEAAGSELTVDALDLKRRAAEQLLISGHLEEGSAVIASVTGALGMNPPRTVRATVWSILYHRARLALRGRAPKRAGGTPSPEELLRIDTCLAGGRGLVLIDGLRGVDFFCRALLGALSSGDRFRSAIALAGDTATTVAFRMKGEAHRKRAFATLHQAAQSAGEPLAIGTAMFTEGGVRVMAGEWKAGLEVLKRAEAIFREQCMGAFWEINAGRLFQLIALYVTGAVRTMAELASDCIRESELRGNVFGSAIGRSDVNNTAWLCDGDVEEARRQADLAIGQWTPSGFHQQHMWDLMARSNLDLYTGADSWSHLDSARAAALKSNVFRLQFNRVWLLEERGRAAIAAARATTEGETRRRLLTHVEAVARRLEREGERWSIAFSIMLHAQVETVSGRLEDAATRLDEAVRAFDAVEMEMHAAVARHHLGHLIGGDAGAQLLAAANTWMSRERIREPERWMTMLAPGLAPRSP